MKVYVDLSSPEHSQCSKMPSVLFHLFYIGGNNLLSMIDSTGCPNSGGQHKLVVSGQRLDVVAWLDLLVEEYPCISEEIHAVKRDIRHKFLAGETTRCGNIRVKLADLSHRATSDNPAAVSAEGV